MLISRNKLVTSRYQDAFTIYRRQLVDDKSVASCQQTGCKLLSMLEYYPMQVCSKLFQQVIRSMILTNLLLVDEIAKFVATCCQAASSWEN